MTTKAFYIGYSNAGGNLGVLAYITQTGGPNYILNVTLTGVTETSTAANIEALVPAAVNATCLSILGFTPDSGEWVFTPAAQPTKAISNPTRSMDTAFQPSATRDTLGVYSVSIASTLSLTGGQLGSVVLEYADDSGFTTNVKTVAQATNGNTGTLTVGLNTVQTQGTTLSGIIPAGKYARLRSVDTTGSPTQTFVNAQEVQL